MIIIIRIIIMMMMMIIIIMMMIILKQEVERLEADAPAEPSAVHVLEGKRERGGGVRVVGAVQSAISGAFRRHSRQIGIGIKVLLLGLYSSYFG